MPFFTTLKRSSYQDRLGTSIGKARGKEASYANGSGWSPSNNGTAALANRAVFGAVQSRFKDAILQVNSTRAKLDNASIALQVRRTVVLSHFYI